MDIRFFVGPADPASIELPRELTTVRAEHVPPPRGLVRLPQVGYLPYRVLEVEVTYPQRLGSEPYARVLLCRDDRVRRLPKYED